MKSFNQYISESGIEPVKPVVPIQPELPKRKQPDPEKNPEKKETGLPEREPDKFIPTRDYPEFKPYKRTP
jgi:hypothetical protein